MASLQRCKGKDAVKNCDLTLFAWTNARWHANGYAVLFPIWPLSKLNHQNLTVCCARTRASSMNWIFISPWRPSHWRPLSKTVSSALEKQRKSGQSVAIVDHDVRTTFRDLGENHSLRMYAPSLQPWLSLKPNNPTSVELAENNKANSNKRFAGNRNARAPTIG